MQFLDVRTDFAFKKVFGSIENKEILISFLNAIIAFPSDQKIKDLTIIDPYNIPMIKGMKDTFVDVKAILENGEMVIVEMQVLNHDGFEKRILYNAAKNYSAQLKKGERYHLLNPVIALTITDFIMFKETDRVITNFKLLEKEEFIDYSDDIELIFVELPKFDKKLEELSDIKEQWIYFLKNAGELNYIPKNMNLEIQKALQIANKACMSDEELEAQRKRKDFIYIQKASISLAERNGMERGIRKGLEQGLEQGIEQGIIKGKMEGIEEGVKQEKIAIAKNLLDILDNETISQKLRLSIEDVESLR